MTADTCACIAFTVHGDAVPKQSFRVSNDAGKVHGYTPERVRAWEEEVAWAAKQALDGSAPLAGPVRVAVEFYLTDRRRRDLDNCFKPVGDALKAAGVYRDDSQIVDLHLSKHYTARGQGHVCIYVNEENV